MRFKLDENLAPRFAPLLAEGGHDVATVRDEGLGGAADETLYSEAVGERRTLITLDFSNPVRFSTTGTAGIVVLRVARPLLSLVESALRSALPQLTSGAVAGKLWIVEEGRIREHRPWDDDLGS